MKNWAIIVAAGKGVRAGFEINKCYIKLKGKTVLARSYDALKDSGFFDGITVVISKSDRALFDSLGITDCHIAYGGDTRRQSVLNGLKTVPDDTDIVAIHDAARPFITVSAIKLAIDDALKTGSGIAATPVTDTIKEIGDDGHIITPDRSRLFAAQTPQVFDFKMLMEAHRKAEADGFEATDDAMIFDKYCGNVTLSVCPENVTNIKLTHKNDFLRAGDNTMDLRIGHGFDAHRLKEGRKLILCGVDVPYEKGLDGHSDADVAVHALMDAMLGALALGDIGKLFPDSDDRYKGISSLLLLKEVNRVIAEKGYKLSNADITIIAQRPKLASFIEQMRINIAEILVCDVSRISVKATTTEKMGYEGDGTGISSHAVVLLKENFV